MIDRLTALPPDIGKLQQLRKLSLRHNPIQSLPLCLRTMPHLKTINTYGSPYYQRRMQRLLKKTPQPVR